MTNFERSESMGSASLTHPTLAVFLCIVGIRLTRAINPIETFLTAVFLVFCFLICVLLSYANWGITSGMFWHPDTETVMLNDGIAGLGLILMATIFVVAFAMRYVPRLYHKYAK